MRHFLFALFFVLLLIACGGGAVRPPDTPGGPLPLAPTPTEAPEGFFASLRRDDPTATPTLVQVSVNSLALDAALPQGLQAIVHTIPDLRIADDAAARLTIDAGEPVGSWVLVPVVSFFDTRDGVTLAELQQAYQSGQLLLDGETARLLALRWGPAPVAAVDDVASQLWQQPQRLAVLPFHLLSPRVKPLRVDGMSALDAALDISAYPLTFSVGVSGPPQSVAHLRSRLLEPLSNRHAHKLTSLALTGVTALVRATAYEMETNGVLWPGEEVRDVLRAADFAHISNEVSFVDDCPYPNRYGGTSFCSAPSYFELLQDIGTDIIELTGNHLSDYGSGYLATTIDLYEAQGMQVYGGGRNLAEAAQPLVIEHNGNTVVLIGCNSFGPAYAWATAGAPGARPCDASVLEQVKEYSSSGATVIVTLQYTEYYLYQPVGQQQSDFRRYIDAGASVVSGSQGHHAQAIDLYSGGFIHFGLGNLFFDQMDALGTRQAFIDELIVYDGRLIAVELHTFLIENYARPRLMTAAEREDLLQTIFAVSDAPD